MEECLLIHPENVERAKQGLKIQVAIIARPDWFIEENRCRHVIVEPLRGTHLRCYLASYGGVNFLIVYGRFDRVRTTSGDINFVLTQEVITFLGIRKIVGTFSVGSIKESSRAGEVYIPNDFVGLGGYNQSMNLEHGFRNVDMIRPFCEGIRQNLIGVARKVSFPIRDKGVYACFHGYPRIETQAELDFYASQGWDIVGQTLDPEATLARESGCHYAALAATIDDRLIRERFLDNDPDAREEIDRNIVEGRRRTFEIFLLSLPELAKYESYGCNCMEQEAHVNKASRNFFYRPRFLCE